MTIEGAIAELQNLIKADDMPFYYNGAIQKVIETIIDECKPKVGRWIDHKEIIYTDPEIWGYSQECSLCGFTLGAKEYNYCPNCGAKIERRADEHNTERD